MSLGLSDPSRRSSNSRLNQRGSNLVEHVSEGLGGLVDAHSYCVEVSASPAHHQRVASTSHQPSRYIGERMQIQKSVQSPSAATSASRLHLSTQPEDLWWKGSSGPLNADCAPPLDTRANSIAVESARCAEARFWHSSLSKAPAMSGLSRARTPDEALGERRPTYAGNAPNPNTHEPHLLPCARPANDVGHRASPQWACVSDDLSPASKTGVVTFLLQGYPLVLSPSPSGRPLRCTLRTPQKFASDTLDNQPARFCQGHRPHATSSISSDGQCAPSHMGAVDVEKWFHCRAAMI